MTRRSGTGGFGSAARCACPASSSDPIGPMRGHVRDGDHERDGTEPRGPAAGSGGAGRADLHLVRPGIHGTDRPHHRARRPPAEGRAVLAGERGGGLPPLQLRPRSPRPGGMARGVCAARLAARRAAAGAVAAPSGGGDRPAWAGSAGRVPTSMPSCAGCTAGRRPVGSVGGVTEAGRRVVGRLEQIWVYPVKSLAGVSVPAVELGPAGPRGDRATVVGDDASASRSGRRTRRCWPRWRRGGSGRRTSAPIADALGRPVRLEPRRPASADARRRAPGLPAGDRPRRAGEVPDGCSADDPRANLLLSLPEDDERTWVGRRLRVGDVVLEVTRTPKHCLGVYAEVRHGGVVTVGDPVLIQPPAGRPGRGGSGHRSRAAGRRALGSGGLSSPIPPGPPQEFLCPPRPRRPPPPRSGCRPGPRRCRRSRTPASRSRARTARSSSARSPPVT